MGTLQKLVSNDQYTKMVLKRNQFYLLLLGLFISPFILYKIGWLAFSKKTTGTVEYIGETRGRRIGRQVYPVVQFTTDSKHVVTISGDYNLPYAPGDDYRITGLMRLMQGLIHFGDAGLKQSSGASLFLLLFLSFLSGQI